MPDFDKIPSVEQLVDNGKKAAETYERNPTGSFVWIILVISFAMTITFGLLWYKAQKQLNDMAQAAFNQAMQNNIQKEVNQVQKNTIQETKQELEAKIKDK